MTNTHTSPNLGRHSELRIDICNTSSTSNRTHYSLHRKQAPSRAKRPNFEEAVVSFKDGNTRTHVHTSLPWLWLTGRQVNHRAFSGCSGVCCSLIAIHQAPPHLHLICIVVQQGKRLALGRGEMGGGRRTALIFNKMIWRRYKDPTTSQESQHRTE